MRRWPLVRFPPCCRSRMYNRAGSNQIADARTWSSDSAAFTAIEQREFRCGRVVRSVPSQPELAPAQVRVCGGIASKEYLSTLTRIFYTSMRNELMLFSCSPLREERDDLEQALAVGPHGK